MLLTELESSRGKIYKDVCTLAVQILSAQDKLQLIVLDLESLEKSVKDYTAHLKMLKDADLVSLDIYKKMCYTLGTHQNLLGESKECLALAKSKVDGLLEAKSQLEDVVKDLDSKIQKASKNVLVFKKA
jgi:hypothetical protein